MTESASARLQTADAVTPVLRNVHLHTQREPDVTGWSAVGQCLESSATSKSGEPEVVHQ